MPATSPVNQQTAKYEQIAKVFKGDCAQRNICPVKDILSSFADKWSIYTILLLGQNQCSRFNGLKANIPGISQRMLTVTLRNLEENGIILRTHYPQIPPRVEYELTELGKSLLDQMLSLANWADEHFMEIMKSRKQYAVKNHL